MNTNNRYQIFNTRTGETVSSRSTRKAASRLVDKLDSQYGAYVHGVREIPAGDVIRDRNGMQRRSILSMLPLTDAEKAVR
jgi:hypothetical protein